MGNLPTSACLLTGKRPLERWACNATGAAYHVQRTDDARATNERHRQAVQGVRRRALGGAPTPYPTPRPARTVRIVAGSPSTRLPRPRSADKYWVCPATCSVPFLEHQRTWSTSLMWKVNGDSVEGRWDGGVLRPLPFTTRVY